MNDQKKPHVVWHEHLVTREQREQKFNQRGCVVWFTGLSGCGKSTVANAAERLLHDSGATTFLLDGDNLRHDLCAGPDRLRDSHGEEFAKRFGLGFGALDRAENIRRVGAVATLFASAGLITLTAFVSPYRQDRQLVRDRVEAAGREGDFIEVFMDTPLEICEQRDPKGLYKKARTGELPNFTGISDPYESPEKPELRLDGSQQLSPDNYANQVIEHLRQNRIL
jgi:adenylylsulfate kinase